MRRPRFIIASVTGHDELEGSRTARPRTTYYILDTAFAFRVVASFPSRGHLHRAGSRLAQARRVVDSLNAGDREWRDALARDSELAV
jgi:hypothetical protein